jgi:hypothetical protein
MAYHPRAIDAIMEGIYGGLWENLILDAIIPGGTNP